MNDNETKPALDKVAAERAQAGVDKIRAWWKGLSRNGRRLVLAGLAAFLLLSVVGAVASGGSSPSDDVPSGGRVRSELQRIWDATRPSLQRSLCAGYYAHPAYQANMLAIQDPRMTALEADYLLDANC